MSLKKLLFILFSIIFIANLGRLSASCGALSCPVEKYSEADPVPGLTILDYSYQYINQDEVRAGTDKVGVGQIRGHHDEMFTVSRVQTLQAAVYLHSRFSATVALPMIQREHQHIHNHRGATLLESWNFSGLGDASLVTRTNIVKYSERKYPSISLILGGKFPTGKTNARGIVQLTNNALQSEEAEIGIQPGSGAYDFLTGISNEQSFRVPMATSESGEMPVILEVMGRFTGKGKDDYRLGNTLTAATGALYPVTRKLGVSMQANLKYSKKDEAGSTGEDIDRTGGVWVYATPGIKLNLTDNWGAYTDVQIPVYQNVNVIQLVSTYNLLFGVTYKFNLIK